MGGKTQQATTKTELPAFAQKAYEDLFGRATTASQAPYQQYTGARQAGLDPAQTAAFQRIGNLGNIFAPYAAQASTQIGASAAPVSGAMTPWMTAAGDSAGLAGASAVDALPGVAQGLMSPYIQDVINATMANVQRENATAQGGLLGKAISTGANPFGGDRAGLAAAELERSQGLARNQTIADLYNTGWQQATQTGLGALTADQQARAAQAQIYSQLAQLGLSGATADSAAAAKAAELYSGLGTSAFNTQQAAAKAQLDAGNQRQKLAQDRLDIAYKDYLTKQGWTKDQLAWLSGIISGKGDLGNTTTETKPGPSLLSSILGAITAGIGAFAKDGGRIDDDHFAIGGAPWDMAGGADGAMPWDNPMEQFDHHLQVLPDSPSIVPGGLGGEIAQPHTDSTSTPIPKDIEAFRRALNMGRPNAEAVASSNQALGLAASPEARQSIREGANEPAPPAGTPPLATAPAVEAAVHGLLDSSPDTTASTSTGLAAGSEEAPSGLGGFMHRIGNDPWRMALVLGGLNTMGSESPFPMAALGQGLAAGVESASKIREVRADRQQRTEEARLAREQHQADLDAQTEVVTAADGHVWVIHPSTGEKLDLGPIGKVTATDTTEIERELVREGMKPGTPEWSKRFEELKRASSGTPIGNQETQNAKDTGAAYSKDYFTMRTEAATAQDQIGNLNLLSNLMATPGFYSGTGAPAVQALKRGWAALGGDPKAAASMEAFNALVKDAALKQMGGSLGTGFSNADRDFVTGQVPDLANTPVGNELLVEIARRKAVRLQERFELARDYAAKHGGQLDVGFDNELAQWAKQHPVFDDAFKTKVETITGASAAPGADHGGPPAPAGWEQEWPNLNPEEKARVLKLTQPAAAP